MRAAHFQCGFFYPIQQSTFEGKIDVNANGEGEREPETETERKGKGSGKRGREEEIREERCRGQRLLCFASLCTCRPQCEYPRRGSQILTTNMTGHIN